MYKKSMKITKKQYLFLEAEINNFIEKHKNRYKKFKKRYKKKNLSKTRFVFDIFYNLSYSFTSNIVSNWNLKTDHLETALKNIINY